MGWFSKEKEPKEVTPEPKPTKVKVLGVRTTEETGGISRTTVNSTLYCLLVEFEDGSRDILEYEAFDPRFHAMLHLIPMD